MSNEPELKWWGQTDKGPFRKNNEDAFLALSFDANEVRLLGKEGEADFSLGDFVFAVSDGMGGANAGEFASRIAVQAITQRFPRHYRASEAEAEAVLVRLFEQIHAEMLVMGQHYEECKGMGATLSLLWLTPERGYFCHVGDSRIYRLSSKGELEQLTDDHTHVGWFYREGKINGREARYHDGRHALQMVLGGQRTVVQPQCGFFQRQRGDSFVLCTDGLIEGLWDSSIRNIVQNPPPRLSGLNPAARLMKEALTESGRDNTTVVVVETGERE